MEGHSRAQTRAFYAPQPPGEEIDGRMHGIGRSLILDVNHVRPAAVNQVQQDAPAAPIPLLDNRADLQACYGSGLDRGGHLHLAAQIAQGQPELAGVIADPPLHGWELTRDEQHFHGPAPRNPDLSTWR